MAEFYCMLLLTICTLTLYFSHRPLLILFILSCSRSLPVPLLPPLVLHYLLFFLLYWYCCILYYYYCPVNNSLLLLLIDFLFVCYHYLPFHLHGWIQAYTFCWIWFCKMSLHPQACRLAKERQIQFPGGRLATLLLLLYNYYYSCRYGCLYGQGCVLCQPSLPSWPSGLSQPGSDTQRDPLYVCHCAISSTALPTWPGESA